MQAEGRGGIRRTATWLAVAVPALLLLRPALRGAARAVVRRMVGRLMTDPYAENLWELISASRRPGLQGIVETNLRAEHGTVIQRPLGSPKRWPDLRNLVFDVAQLAKPPAGHDIVVDMRVTIGPRAKRPLRVSTPLLVSGMAWGLAVSLETKLALARGTALVDTATNTGEGVSHPLERAFARHLIVQFNRGGWGKSLEELRRADMIELQVGQGAQGGIGIKSPSHRLEPALRRAMGLRPGRPLVTESQFPERRRMTLPALVAWLRSVTDGVPIGVKLAPGKQLEADLERCLDAGVDVIAVDGAQAATKGSPPILQDDFGIPTLHALLRAVDFLERSGRRDQVSLIIGGGLYDPGDFLKVIALGADAVYIGSMALFALSHLQVFKALPWEPPTQLVFAGGKAADRLDVEQAAKRLANYLRSCTEEMALGVRSLGKTALSQLSRDDLMALDPVTAEICRVAPTYRAP